MPPSGKIVLVVDDDLDFLDTVALVLSAEGYRVETATNGSAALERLRTGAAPDLILMDLMMPGMDGWTLRQHLATDPALAQIPVAVLSGDHAALQMCPPTGVVRCLRKPVSLSTLLSIVRNEL